MRPTHAAAVSVAAAVLGGVLVLAVAKAAGWLDQGTSTTVVREQASAGLASPVVVAKPIAGNGFSPARIYRERSAGVVTIFSLFNANGAPDANAGQGSGFVVDRNGTVLTSAHVITTAGQGGAALAPAHAVYVEFPDGDRVQARIVGYDVFDDVGVLRIDSRAHALAPVPLGNSSRVVVGQPVAAIGSPFGNVDSLSVGVVSAVHRSIPSLTTNYDLVDAIQTDAPINHGNSGGPLFDDRGRVIGINAQIRSTGDTSGFEGVGFAVPIDSAKRSLAELDASGKVHYAYVGITTEDLTPSIAKKFGYAATRGALIDSFADGNPAGKRAGLRAAKRIEVFQGESVHVGGDAVVAIAGIPVRNAEDLVRVVAERLVPGETATFTVVRGSRRVDVPVKLDERPQ